MKTYIGIKRVKATPMLAKDAFDAGYLIGKSGPDDSGYEVEYKNGYMSWSPAEPFEEAYQETSPEDWDKPAVIEPQTVRVAVQSTLGMVGVKYIGNRESHIDNLYGTGLEWVPGQAHNVAKATAKMLLSHADVYEECEADSNEVVLSQPANGEKDEGRMTALPNLEGMDKDALVTFAQQHFGERMHKTMKEDTMRERILGMIQERGLE